MGSKIEESWIPILLNYPLAVLGGWSPPDPYLEARTVAGTRLCRAEDPPRQAGGLRMAYGAPYPNLLSFPFPDSFFLILSFIYIQEIRRPVGV